MGRVAPGALALLQPAAKQLALGLSLGSAGRLLGHTGYNQYGLQALREGHGDQRRGNAHRLRERCGYAYGRSGHRQEGERGQLEWSHYC